MTRGRWFGLAAMAGLAALALALARPAPRLPAPLPLTSDVTQPEVLHDLRGDAALQGLRTIEEGVFYTGSSLPLSYEAPKPGGGVERIYPDETAFNALRDRKVRLVVSLQSAEPAFREEEGYLQFWKDQTGYAITPRWLPVPAEHVFGLSDQSAMRAAAELISDLKREWPLTGAVYLHGGDNADAAGVVIAAYELWRNRGWTDPDSLWEHIEQRFMLGPGAAVANAGAASRLLSFRALRRRMEYLAEL